MHNFNTFNINSRENNVILTEWRVESRESRIESDKGFKVIQDFKDFKDFRGFRGFRVFSGSGAGGAVLEICEQNAYFYSILLHISYFRYNFAAKTTIFINLERKLQ